MKNEQKEILLIWRRRLETAKAELAQADIKYQVAALTFTSEARDFFKDDVLYKKEILALTQRMSRRALTRKMK